MSGMLIQLGLPTADTIVHNFHVLFASHCLLSRNEIVKLYCLNVFIVSGQLDLLH